MANETVKALLQKIYELEKEKLELENKLKDSQNDNDELTQRLLDLEACN